MSELYLEKELNDGKTLKVFFSDVDESPREWCNLGELYLPTRSLSHLNEYEGSIDYEDYSGWEELQTAFEREGYIVLPLYKYEHGGVAYSTSPFGCRWDSGQVGFILADREKVRKEYGKKRISPQLFKKVCGYLESEVRVFSSWANGDVFDYIIEDEDEDVIDSCGGFYGTDFKANGLYEHAEVEYAG